MSYVAYGSNRPAIDYKFFTLLDLYNLAKKYPEHKFTLIDTLYSLDEVKSWRGSYEIPSMTPTLEERTGADIAKEIQDKEGKLMRGYKGGEFYIGVDDEFYISQWGACEEYKISGYMVREKEVILITNLDEY